MYTVFLFYLYSFYLVDAKLLTSFRSSSGVCSQCCFSFLFIIWIAQSPLTFKRLLKKNYSLWVLFVIKSYQQSVNSSIRRAQVCLSHTIDPRTDTSIIQTQPGSVVSVLRGTRKKTKIPSWNYSVTETWHLWQIIRGLILIRPNCFIKLLICVPCSCKISEYDLTKV